MKQKLLLGIASCLMTLIGFNASAQSIDEVRIYINPGHGAFCSSCRPMSTIKHGSYKNYQNGDTTGFYESNTNLQKGFGLLEKLIEYGVPFDRFKGARDLTQNLVMSRVKSGDVHDGLYDRSLADIAAEVEQNNFDMFISIHSNATSGSHDISTHVNHCLYLYRGWDGDPYNSGSHEMAMACWPHSMANEHMNYNWLADPTTPFDSGCTYGNNNKAAGWYYYPSGYYDAENKIPYWIKGDVTFQYGYLGEYTREDSYRLLLGSDGEAHTRYYGVLNHTVPGFLVEGYDHTYDPARHRAMNWDVCRMEGVDYAKGINDYFGWGKSDNYGYVYGVVRDHTITMTHQYYSVSITSTEDDNQCINPIDKCKPLNGVKVSLYNSTGEEVDTYTTDDEWNGAYVFKGVAPGTYTLKHYHASYGIVEETVIVTANKTSYLNVDMSKALVARQGHYAYGLTSSLSNGVYTLSFKSTGAMDNANIIFTNSSTGEKITIETGAIVKGDNSVTIKATDLGTTDNYSWAVAFENLTSANYQLLHEDNSIVYNNGSANARIGLAIDKDETSANFGTIYTMTALGQGLQRYNPDFTKNGSKVLANMFGYDTESSTSSNKYKRPNRLTVNSGKVYIANYAAQNPGVWVYNPSGTTATNIINGKYEKAVAFLGEGANRVMYVSHESSFRYYNVGTADTWAGNTSSPSGTLSDLSTLLANGDGDVLATEYGLFASQLRYQGSNTSGVPVFVFADNSGTVLFNSSSIASTLKGSQGGGMAITSDLSTFAIVDGWAQDASNNGIPGDIEIDIFNVTWSSGTPSFTYQYSIPLTGTQQVDQMEFDHADNLYVASQQKGLLVYAVKMPERTTTTTATSTLQGAVAPAVQGHFAYDLAATQSGSDITFTFKSTGAMDNAKIILTNTATGATHTIETGAIVKGENIINFDATELNTTNTFSWTVAIDNPCSPNYEQIYSDNIAYNNGSAYARGGVAIDLDQTSANFGTIYTSTGYGQGIRSYNPDFTKNGSAILGGSFNSSNSSSPYRIASSNGKVYITDWSDAHGGLWVYDPEAGASVTNMFVGTNDGKGCIKNGSTVTGGGTTGVSFIGEGSSRQLYVFCEDYPSGNAGNQLLRYDLGSADSWSVAPSANYTQMAASSLFPNTNVVVLATDKGVFCSQTRYTNSNQSYMPTLAFMDNSGAVTYNSGIDDASNQGGCQEGAMAIYGDIFAIVDGYAQGSPTNINIEIYSITWSGTTPSLTYQYEIPMNGTTQISQLAFDHAGNLYAYSRQQGLLVYAIKTEARTTTTKANSTVQGAIPPAVRGHYAYDLKMESTEDYYTFTFYSTGDVDQAYIVLVPTMAGYAEQVINIGDVTKGENRYSLDRAAMKAYRDGKDGYSYYNWAVRFDNPASPSVEKYFVDNIAYNNGTTYARGGVAIDLDEASANFGTIYASTGFAQGVYVYEPDLTRQGDPILGESFNSANRHSPFRLASSEGKLYIADWSDAHGGVWMYDPKAGETVTNVFSGTYGTGGQIVNNSVAVGGGVTSMAFVGEGAERKMFVLCEDYPTGNAGNTVLRYDLGDVDSWTSAPTANFGTPDAWLSLSPSGSTNVEIFSAGNGIFVASSGLYSPAFVYSDVDGNLMYNSATSMSSHSGNYGGGIAANDNTLAVVDTNSDIKIYSIEWNTPEVVAYSGNTTSVPTLTYQYTIETEYTGNPNAGQEITQMALDPAGNLYLYSQADGLVSYTLKSDARQTITNHATDILVPADIVGIEDVLAGEDDAEAVYYNLQGYKIAADELNPGTVYIKVACGKATKIVYSDK